jgi:subtilase family serine protease
MALDLFVSDFETESYKANGFYSRDDFFAFGTRIGIPEKRINRIINEIIGQKDRVRDLLSRSFLDDQLKTRYAAVVEERARAIGYSHR